jgi:hypothetical protein
VKVEKLAKNGQKGQNCYPLSPRPDHDEEAIMRGIEDDEEEAMMRDMEDEEEAMDVDVEEEVLLSLYGPLEVQDDEGPDEDEEAAMRDM